METEHQAPGRFDPYNWPAMNRCDLMSRTALSQEKDLIWLKTPHMQNKNRRMSQNLVTSDIKGKFQISFKQRSHSLVW